MAFGTERRKELQEDGAWVPKTPAKSIPERQGPVFEYRTRNNHVAGHFSAGTSQDSTEASADFIDAIQSLKEGTGSESDLNKTPCELGNLGNGYSEDVLAGKQGRLNDGLLEGISDGQACVSGVAKNSGSMGCDTFENSSRGADNCGAAFSCLDDQKSRNPAFSTPSKKRNSKRRHKDDVNLNNESRKKPRRKKYWPKVVVEFKTKKKPKPSTPKPRTPKPSKQATSTRGSNGKRKDAGNNGLHASAKPSKDARIVGQAVDENCVSESGTQVLTATFCLENHERNFVQKNNLKASARQAFNFNLQNQDSNYGKGAQTIIHEYQRRKKKIDLSSCDSKPCDRQGNEVSEEGNESIVKNPTNMTIGLIWCENFNQSTYVSVAEREIANDTCAINETGCHNNCLKVYQRRFRMNQCPSNSRKLGPIFPRMWKKRRMRRQKKVVISTFIVAKDGMGRQTTDPYYTLQSIIRAEDSQRIPKKRRIRRRTSTKFGTWRSVRATKKEQRGVKSSNCTSRTRKARSASQFNGNNLPVGVKNSLMICRSAAANSDCLVPNCLERIISPSKSQSLAAVNDPISFKCVLSLTPLAMSKKKRFNKYTRRLYSGTSTVISSWNQLPPTLVTQTINDCAGNREVLLADNENMATEKQFQMGFLDNAVTDHNKKEGCLEDVFTPLESLQDDFSIELADVIKRLENMHIGDEGGQLVVRNQDAYGKFRGNRAITLYKSKKRSPPPRVDIDPETMRVWKSLMANRGEDVDGERDKDKEKWWEEQRKVFHGRVDSFIARMHLIQGDRRFSPWKGSVLDSVVGVFLTQNVSDHLSSSAFMSLAAKFPVRSTTEFKACDEEMETACNQELDGSNKRATVQDQAQDEFSRSVFPKIVQLEETTSLQEFSSEKGEVLANEAFAGSNISRKLENGKQESNLNRLYDVNGTCAFVHSPGSENPYTCIPLIPSDLEVEPQETHANFTDTKIKDEGDVCKNLGYMESFGSEDIVQQMARPRVQEVTVDLCASLSVCQMLPQCSSQEEVKHPKGRFSTKSRPGNSEVILQTKTPLKKKKSKVEEKQENPINWDDLKKAYASGAATETSDTMDSVDWEGVRQATFDEVADAIKGRGQHNVLAKRIKDLLDRLVRDHGSTNLEWLRSVPPDKAKEYLLSFKGLGLKSVECVRLLALHHHAFPVDTNVGRVAVRLGWVPLQPLPESLQIHLLEQYPLLDTVQVYLWPRLCTLDQQTLYELHYQMITFGKVFCRKKKPNCNACPMRAECKHFASAFSSSRLSLPGPQEKSMVSSMVPVTPATTSIPEATFSEARYQSKNCEPIIEYPPSPEPEMTENLDRDIEDFYVEDADEIPVIRLDTATLEKSIRELIEKNNINLEGGEISKALVALAPEAASIPVPKLKEIGRLRTLHRVYELPDSHLILSGFDKREPDDPCPYLLTIWTSGETAISSNPSRKQCDSRGSELCNEDACCSSDNIQDQNFQTVCGTIFIPCRTAARGRFPLNGTYFQVNEVFADNETSQNPIIVPRSWIWNLRRRNLYCGASASPIFRGLSTEEIQSCFWRGFICCREFNRNTRAPKHLSERFHVSTVQRGKGKFTE